ncbi:MAG: proteobacterial dedicated sortase system histidine kinase [Thalassotalea sp.]
MPRRKSFRFGLRLKLFLLSLFLFAIPLLGYQYVWEMEKYLRIGQEKTLMGTVRAVATALHERPKLFDEQASFLPNVQKGRDLYAYPIVDPIRLDGDLSDWRNRHHALVYQDDYVIEGKNVYQADTLSFTHMVGKYRQYLYAYFDVIDEDIVYRGKNSLKVDQNDLLQIAFVTPAGDFRRYLVATTAAGWLTPYELTTASADNIPLAPESRIQGMWQETPKGYIIELRLPLELLGSQLSFAITDVDSKRSEKVTLGTAQFTSADTLGTVLLPSPEIEKILKGLGHTESRIWVVDQHGRVLAKAGDITRSDGVWSSIANQSANRGRDNNWYQPIKDFLASLYQKVLTTPPKTFTDELYDAGQLKGSHLTKALTGEGAATWRLTTDKQAVILSAAYPIYSDGKVMGAVIAEETTNGIRTLRNNALQGWFNVILAVMVLGTLAIFIFASRISSRIRALNIQTVQAIDEQGRIVQPILLSKASDEVGDLQRSFANMVERLGQYTQYLQGMSARLSHELRTPVAVVKSSLESLVMDSPEVQNNVYMQRANEGIKRLSSILTLMSEATRLEQSLANTDISHFNIDEVVSGCVQGYKLTQPQQQFELLITPLEQQKVLGNPELFAQLLDKLLANAVEFAEPDSVIVIKLAQVQQQAVLTIRNTGQCLPEKMQERLFDSMVSVRSGGTKQSTDTQEREQPHLGLGLYIARLIAEFHQGSIELINDGYSTNNAHSDAKLTSMSADNKKHEKPGVIAKVTIPFIN